MDGVMSFGRRSFPQAWYVILYVSVLLAFVIIGAFFGRMFYSVTDAASVTVSHDAAVYDDIGKMILDCAKTETPTAIELIMVFLAPLTLIPTVMRSAVIAYRGAALGWCFALLPICTGTYAAVTVCCYAAAAVIMLVFAAESSVKAPETDGTDGKIRYFVGFLVMSAAVFAVELIPTVTVR